MLRPSARTQQEKNALAKEGIVFLFTLFLVSGGLYLVLSPLEIHMQTLETNHVRGMLNSVGVVSRDAELPHQFSVNEKLIEISPLCSGFVEMVLLIGAIAATRNVSWKKRALGIIAGVLALYVLNLFRIVITILQLVHTNLAFAEFTHDILFRVGLILGFAIIYGAWSRTATDGFLEKSTKGVH